MKRIKRMLGILVSLCVLLSQGLSLVCVQAGSNDGAVSLQCLDVCVEVGEQYNNVPAKAQIHLSSDRADGQYELGLFYQNGVSADEIHGEGTADGEGRITMEIPADKAAALQGGVYLVKGTIEGQAVQCEVTLAENTMRQSGVTAETDVIFEDGAGGKKEVSNIFDNMDTNFIAVSGQPYPQIITINYENENTLFAASLYSNYGASFGISNMKLNYRTPEGAWAPVRNKEGGEEFPQSWTTTDQFQRNDLVFDQPYTTTGLQIVVLSSNEAWGESTNISEFQTWGMRKGGVEPPPVKTLKQDAKGSLFFDIMSENETLDALTDKDFSTSFKGTLTTKDYLKFKSPGNTVNRGFVLHASQPQENLKKVTVKVPAHTDDALIELERGLKPVWEPDGHGYKAEFSVDTLAVVPLLWVDLEGQGDIELTEVEWLGDTFTGNILGNAKTTLNGEGFSNAVMTDNNIYSMENFTWEGPAVFEFDFTPGEILADSMYYLTNYGQGQGFKKVKLEGFDGENWKELAAEQEFVWKTSNDLREAQEITFDQTKVSRLRLTILDANHVWGNVTIGELYVHGKEIISAESMAQQITSVKVPARGQERLEMPDLGRFAEDFEVAINFSGDEGVIALDGTIHTPAISKIVELTFLVRSKIDGSTALTASIPVLVLGELSDAVVKTDVAEDTQDVIYNPSMGWVCYIEDCYRNVDPQTGRYNSDLNTVCQGRTVEEYWQEFDGYCEKGLTPHILYIRTVWAWFEPEEGKYAWKDPDSELSRLVKGAEERNLQLAFRVLIDSTDNSEQAVPEWVYEAGARGAVTGADGLKDVYINDPVFLEKFENFLDAFAAEYDNGQTAYIDGFGAGDWGEGNRIMYDSAISSQDEAVRGILDLYNEKIQNVLLGMQHASEADWKYAYENGFVVRRDSFGSPRWFSDSDKKSITGLFAGGNSVFAES